MNANDLLKNIRGFCEVIKQVQRPTALDALELAGAFQQLDMVLTGGEALPHDWNIIRKIQEEEV